MISPSYDHHSVVDYGDGPRPALGEQVTIIPNHVFPAVNLAPELVVVGGSSLRRWVVDARRCTM
jgi:D-serine deaminase-like pyridoxal phosphate-dependent protein